MRVDRCHAETMTWLGVFCWSMSHELVADERIPFGKAPIVDYTHITESYVKTCYEAVLKSKFSPLVEAIKHLWRAFKAKASLLYLDAFLLEIQVWHNASMSIFGHGRSVVDV
jgi:hypothetical protein